MTDVKTFQQELEQRSASIQALAHLWQLAISNGVPSNGQFAVWLDLHKFEHIVHAIKVTGHKQSRTAVKMSDDHLVRMVSSIANRRKLEVKRYEARMAATAA